MLYKPVKTEIRLKHKSSRISLRRICDRWRVKRNVQRETALYARDSSSHFSTRTRTVRYTVPVRRSTWFLIPSPSHAAKVPIFPSAKRSAPQYYIVIYMKLPFLSVAYFCASHATNITLKSTKSITRQKLIHRCADNQNFIEQSNRILVYTVALTKAYSNFIVQVLSGIYIRKERFCSST